MWRRPARAPRTENNGRDDDVGYDWISFTTDYGLSDGFVAACHGVIARFAPGVRMIDVTHAVPPQRLRWGAAVLAQTVPYLPPSVHLAVVDPGVGTDRRPIVVVTDAGVLVGPDNGLLQPAAEALGGVRSAYLLAAPDYRLSAVSATFHGRDIFAPAAAHLAVGVAPERFGPPIDPDSLARLRAPEIDAVPGELSSEVLTVDRFGNIQLAATAKDLAAAGLRRGDHVTIRAEGAMVPATVARTFADVRSGELLVVIDSADHVAVAVNGSSAVERLGEADRLTVARRR
ncbi:hypothetical protein CJ179_30885 [Rhodococcus sp. ACS1]|nr:hypothetical protein CJ179_30885 [Rhodococcus sp. ACS1]